MNIYLDGLSKTMENREDTGREKNTGYPEHEGRVC
jgi:hypothetical protein